MIDISFEINGRKVSPRNMGNDLQSPHAQQIDPELNLYSGEQHGEAGVFHGKALNIGLESLADTLRKHSEDQSTAMSKFADGPLQLQARH